jgi:flagellar biosynthesis chaperone FliJ
VAPFRFRLQRLLDQKLSKKKDAARILATRQRELQAEQHYLAVLKRQADNLARETLTVRLQMLRSEPLFARNLMQQTEYLGGLHNDVESIRKASAAQEYVVDHAKAKLNQACEDLARSSREAEMLKNFRDKLEQRFLKNAERKEEIELDEAGMILYLSRSHER